MRQSFMRTCLLVGSPLFIGILFGLHIAPTEIVDPESPLLYTLITRTKDSEAYIEEVVAYYLAHGSSVVLVRDNSDHDRVHIELLPYIRARKVIYERLRWLEVVGSETDTKKHDGGTIRSAALSFARMAQLTSRPVWLLCVDDDEFVLPGTSPERTLLSYLSQQSSLAYKTIFFQWKFWGSSGLIKTPKEMLSVDVFTRSHSRSAKHGKTAFQLNHPGTDLTMWVDQDNLLNDRGTRMGGPFFLHGNNPLLARVLPNHTSSRWSEFKTTAGGPHNIDYYGEDTKSGQFVTCCTNHLMRGRAQLELHLNNWNNTQVSLNWANELRSRDRNDVENRDLLYWASKIRLVIREIHHDPTARQPFQ